MSLPRTSRSDIVQEARSWIGTPYHHMADVRGHGVDCGMLLVRVYCDLGVAPSFDPRPYTQRWHLHRSEEIYLGFVQQYADEVPAEDVLPGDVVLIRVGRCYSHGGIVVDNSPLTVVHALIDCGCVVEERVRNNPQFWDRLATSKFFRVRDLS